MAKDCSFDVVSNVDLQEVDNAVNQAAKEIATRYDFRGSKSKIEWDKKSITVLGDDDYKLKAVVEILRAKLVKRGVSLKNIEECKPESASGMMMRQEIQIKQGLATETAKEITKLIKASKTKVSTQIMDNQVRVSGKDKDDLQAVIELLKGHDFPVELQFVNYRS